MFKRFAVNNPQVYPNRNYPADIMDKFLNLTNVSSDPDNRILAKVHMICLLLLSQEPKPIMNQHGPQGTGKTVYQELYHDTVDPSATATTSLPSEIKELPQILSHSYVTFFDNVSKIKDDVSDWLCRSVTGSSSSKRGLYTNDEDVIYSLMRAVGYNGINIAAHKPDLLERMLNLEFSAIDKTKRRKLKDIRKEFKKILPDLLGFIFDTVAKVLSRIGTVHLDELSRMADFHEMGELVARCLGCEDGEFDEAYKRNISFTNEEAIDSNPIALALRVFMEINSTWEGKAEQLRKELNETVSRRQDFREILKGKDWPKTSKMLSEELNKIIQNLREIGIVVSKVKDGHTKTYTYNIVNNNWVPEDSLAASTAAKKKGVA